MNDRLPTFASEFPAPSMAPQVTLVPDESTFNYVNRIALLTGQVDRQRVVAALFGHAHVRVDRPLHAGFGHFARQIAGAYETRSHSLAEAHSMLSLFRPFINAQRYDRALD